MLAVVCVGLSSCSKDDNVKNGDDGKKESSLLVGTWILRGQSEEVTFNADGSGARVDKTVTDPFTYTFNSKTMELTFKYKHPETGDSSKTISIKVTEKELVMDGDVYDRKK